MKTFLENLKNELQKTEISEDIVDDIIKDHEEMIEAARAEGISDEEIKNRFGDPKKIAEDIAKFEKKNQYPVRIESKDKVYTFDVDVDEIKILTNLVSEDTTYQVIDSNQIKIDVVGKSDLSKYDVSFENGLLKIETFKRTGFSFGFSFTNTPDFIVNIPKKLLITSLNHNSVNADLKFHHLKLVDVKIQTTDGDIDFKYNRFETLKINTVNGDLCLEDAEAKNLSISTVSGDVDVKNIKLETDLVLNSVNGDLNLKEVKVQNFSVSTVSGDVSLSEVEIRQDLNLKSVSGDLSISDSTADHLYFHTVSGDVNGNEFYLKKISLNSLSGDININNSKKDTIEIIKKKTMSGDVNIN